MNMSIRLETGTLRLPSLRSDQLSKPSNGKGALKFQQAVVEVVAVTNLNISIPMGYMFRPGAAMSNTLESDYGRIFKRTELEFCGAMVEIGHYFKVEPIKFTRSLIVATLLVVVYINSVVVDAAPQKVKSRGLRLCPAGGPSFSMAWSLACEVKRKKRGEKMEIRGEQSHKKQTD
uniref:Uncharacterized protein n=1 Tax=Romanomermis culicivorax TaxID=13658 RepID=A0A915KX67_ROMCU